MTDPGFTSSDLDLDIKLNGLNSVSAQVNMPTIIERLSWKPFETLMDYGCGAGALTSRYLFPVAEKYSSAITGVDASARLVQFAQEKHSHVLAEFIQGDILAEDRFKWPFQNTKFDKILCINVIPLLQNYEELLTRLSTQLHKGSQLALSIPFSQFHMIRRSLCEHPKWSKYFAGAKEESELWTDDPLSFPNHVKLILETLELEILDFVSSEETYTYKSADDFIDFMMETFSTSHEKGLNNIPTKLLGELRKEILHRATQVFSLPEPIEHNKPFPITSNYLRAIVEK